MLNKLPLFVFVIINGTSLTKSTPFKVILLESSSNLITKLEITAFLAISLAIVLVVVMVCPLPTIIPKISTSLSLLNELVKFKSEFNI